ncbi:MAG TPA: DNA translocase FtsK 4TM domain-containing protein [Lachnospiraceae bacterium]|nr:DNA translocase FtsK 4TM domain-containing protein [Lachnospiraceae bacterium]
MAATQKKTTPSGKKTAGNRTSGNKGNSSSGRKRSSTGKGSSHTKDTYGLARYKEEITIVITLVVSVILILSNFNLSGSFGKLINNFTFGLFGLLAYILPYLLFIGVAFRISNKGNYNAIIKLVSSILLFFIIAAFLQLVTTNYNSDWHIIDYYKESAHSKAGGGLVGGTIYSIMYPLFGFAGTLVILVAIISVLLMFITERLFFASIGKTSARKLKAMRDKHLEVKRMREEETYEEDYEDDDEVNPSDTVAENRGVQEDIRRKAKTFTFVPNEEISKQADSLQEPVVELLNSKEAKARAKAAKKQEKVTTQMDTGVQVNMEEVKPFDFDSIPIHRAGQNSPTSDTEVPFYKEEMKRKFSQGKDYDIKKLAKQIMNEDFGHDSFDSVIARDTFMEDVNKNPYEHKTTVVEDGFVMNNSNDNSNTMSIENMDKEDSFDEDIYTKALMNESSVANNSLGSDGVEDNENQFIENRFENTYDNEMPGISNTTEYDTLDEPRQDDKEWESYNQDTKVDSSDDIDRLTDLASEEDFDNFRVDLKLMEGMDEVASKHSDSSMQSHGHTSTHGSTYEQASKEQSIPIVEPPKVYEFPSVNFLSKPKGTTKGATDSELKDTAMKLQKTLESFGVGVTITNVSCGPAVTRYELQPEQGVKVSRITNLADDIKLNLAAADIRIEAPIPGKAAVGIEVPNKENSAVMFRELIESKEFKEHSSNIAFAVGKDIGGQTVVTDIGKMPHLLIAGATGSGKSVCINTLIMSILYKAHPDDVKLIMVDPKVVELSVYNGIPHLLIPVVTDPKKASAALNWAVMEMTERYNKFADLGVRDINGYNTKIEQVAEYNDEKFQKLPQIVIIVDELADLMMVAPGEVEDAICRLAQMARAAGLHLIIATQRPSVNVITGLIKANIPSRIAFSVSSAIDSRTIIDGAGAEKLLGKGDMLFFPSGYPKPVRIQGAFVSDKEVSKVVEFLAGQSSGKSNYSSDVADKIMSIPSSDSSSSSESSDRDYYFIEAGKFIIDKDKASIGMLQRVYKIGFNRAARIMDQLYEAGVVGPEEGTKPRRVLMSMEEFEQYVDEYV